MKRALVITLVLALTVPVLAQEMVQTPTGTIFRQVDFGARPVSVSRDSSKFEEYRDLGEGAFLPFFRLFADEALQYDIVGENVGRQDASYSLRLGTSLFRANVEFEQIPHRFGNDALTLFKPFADGMLAIDDAVQRHCQTELEDQFRADRQGINFAFLSSVLTPHLAEDGEMIDLGLMRRRGRVELRLPPGSSYDVRFAYFQENRQGNRAISGAFGQSSLVELPEPIDYQTREITTSAEVPFRRGLIRGSVQLNEFTNHNPSVLFDNPWRITDSTDSGASSSPGTGSIAGPARGRLSLPPGNRSITGSLGTLVRLPMSSRLSADVSVSRWRQNESFIPYTSNTAITAPVNASDPGALPASSLDGEMNIVSGVVAFHSRLARNLSLNARYRTYDLKNDTPRIVVPGYVRMDALWVANPRISVPFEYSTDRGDVTLAYDLGDVTLEGGYRREVWDRAFRETTETVEGVWRGAADWRLRRWVLLRTSYERGSRSFDHYDPDAEHLSFVNKMPATSLESLRRFDQAARRLDRTSVLLQLTPRGDMVLSLNYLGSEEDFHRSEHGRLNARSRSVTAEADWTPTDRFTINGFYTREALSSLQLSRQSGATPSTDPAADWFADMTTDGDTYGLGGTLGLLPDRLSLRLLGQYQKVNGNNFLDSPPGGAPDRGVPIADYDDSRLWSASAEVDYRLNPTWSVTIGGWVEDYWYRDAWTTGLRNYMPSALFLAANNGDYRGRVFYVKTSYRR